MAGEEERREDDPAQAEVTGDRMFPRLREYVASAEIPEQLKDHWRVLIAGAEAGDREAYGVLLTETMAASKAFAAFYEDAVRQPETDFFLPPMFGNETGGGDAYMPLAGASIVPPGRVLVCPVNPDHYRRHRLSGGWPLFCPDHMDHLVEVVE